MPARKRPGKRPTLERRMRRLEFRLTLYAFDATELDARVANLERYAVDADDLDLEGIRQHLAARRARATAGRRVAKILPRKAASSRAPRKRK